MNQSFENIFEKYNITYNLPRKRKKLIKSPTQSIALNKSRQSLFANIKETSSTNELDSINTTCSSVPNTTTDFYFNNSTKGKYSSPTRYSTLNVYPVKNVNNQLNCSTAKTSFFSESVNNSIGERILKENIPLYESEAQGCVNNSIHSIACKRKSLTCSFNLGKPKQNCKKSTQSTYKQLNITEIPKSIKYFHNTFENESFPDALNGSFTPIGSSSPEASQIIETPSPTQDTPNNTNNELDLLIDLIEREDKNNIKKKKVNKKFNSDILPSTKPCLKGGYEELFERALKRETVKGSFLKHDRKMGLRIGKLLNVIEVQTVYGTTLAVVKREDLNKNFGIIVAPEMVSQLQFGTQIELFFDDNCLPFIVEYNGDLMDVYLEPYKILVV